MITLPRHAPEHAGTPSCDQRSHRRTSWTVFLVARVLAASWAGLLLVSCLDPDEGDLTEPPDGSHCPDDAPAWCDETCVDTASDVSHCGGCGAACEALPHVESLACKEGACAIGACQPGFDDCDGERENGCEEDLSASKDHCGSCKRVCATECWSGTCNDPIEVSAGSAYTCAIRASGSVWCWGDNEEFGNLGVASTENVQPTPQRVELPGAAIAVVTGKLSAPRHTCALLASGAVYCWGANGDGQLGTGNTTGSFTPVLVEVPEATQIAVGGKHTCAVSSEQLLWCWGSNEAGALGLGMATLGENVPKLVLYSVEDVALGGDHTCARLTSDLVACWGVSSSGQVGNGASGDVYVPTQIAGLDGAAQFGLGALHSCARFPNGSLSCWGQGGVGQLGLGTTAIETTPQLVIEAGVSSLAIGASSSSAVFDGEVWAWGLNTDGQLGLGHKDAALVPTKTKLGLIKKMSLGDRHGCKIGPKDELVCWGANDKGQLGVGGTLTESLEPVPVVFPPEGPGSQ